MKNKIKINILVVLSAMFLSSCDGFLETAPYSGIDADKAITNTTNAEASLIGAYDAIQHYYSYGREFVVFGDVLTNNVRISPTNSNRFTGEAAWSWTPSNADYSNYWAKTYAIINSVNNIINAPSIALDATKDEAKQEALKNQIIGEAYAIRAMLHFDLVRLFAQNYNFTADHSHLGIPYVKVHNPANTPARDKVSDVYTNVLADLEEAAKLITTMRSTTGGPYFFSPNALKALYARVYLFMGNYAKAKEYAEQLIPAYTLVPNDDKYLDSWAEVYTTESILTLSYSDIDYNQTAALGYIYVEAGYGDLFASPTFMTLMNEEPTDIRLKWYKKGVAASKANFDYVSGKYPGRLGKPGLDNYNIFRVSEMYLIAAEAAARIGGAANEETARGYLDAIRQRAIPTAAASTATGQDLIDDILLEKRKELAFEGHYFHDLKRLQQTIIGATTGTGAIGATINVGDDRLALPIPQAEMDANPNMEQNPGYGS